jgi:hypothetical protein
MQISSTGGTALSAVVDYTNAGYTERAGSPNFDAIVKAPTISASSALRRAATSYFVEAYFPMQTITFTLRGAGTAAHNVDGFSAGYYLNSSAVPTLQKRWEPGQYVDITCAELGLSGLYRVEQVDWRLMPGSFFQEITITANRKNPNTIRNRLQRGA